MGIAIGIGIIDIVWGKFRAKRTEGLNGFVFLTKTLIGLFQRGKATAITILDHIRSRVYFILYNHQ